MNGPPLPGLGQLLMIGGALLLAVGAFLYFGGSFGPLGRLPGDIRIEGRSGSFYFPLMTSILLSLVLTVVLNLLLSGRGR